MNEVTHTVDSQAELVTQLVPRLEESDGDMIARWESNATALATSIDGATDEGRLLLGRCLSTADLKTRSCVGQTISVVAFMAHVAEVEDKATGELLRKIRVVLVLDDGRTVSTMSKPCVRALSLMVNARKGKPWKTPLLIETREFPLEAGKSYCEMREVIQAPAAKKK